MPLKISFPKMNTAMKRKILLIDCPDAKGLIAKITHVCYQHQLNIINNREYVDHNTGQFFMRTELEGYFNDETFLHDIDPLLPKGSQRKLVDKDHRKKIVIMVTKESHCLGDILMKNYDGSLNVNIVAVISNHETLGVLTQRFDIPFHCISHEGMSREDHEIKLIETIEQYQPDHIILAKFMRILTPYFVTHFAQKIINIHHSFLPAFIGARPYHQAYDRGVKIIGATAHFVTHDLDEGPIIAQNIRHVDHTFSAQDMVKTGRDVEKTVLSQALSLILEDKVFIYGNKTVIL